MAVSRLTRPKRPLRRRSRQAYHQSRRPSQARATAGFRAYAAAGDPPHPSAFDDRSVPFAIASLSYSHAITDVARAWLAAWSQAGGDVGRTPYLERNDRAQP